MFDTRHALADMANQIRTCRTAEGLTLQQLASRSGVAASTIHKVEAQQMVPTVCVLLKIAKGLGCRPERLVRDRFDDDKTEHGLAAASLSPAQTTPSSNISPLAAGPKCPAGGRVKPDVGVWQLDLSADNLFPPLDLDPLQRAIVLVQRGEVDLQAGDLRVQMDAGDCVEIEGGRIESRSGQLESASLMLIVSPPGDLGLRLGQPQPSTPVLS